MALVAVAGKILKSGYIHYLDDQYSEANPFMIDANDLVDFPVNGNIIVNELSGGNTHIYFNPTTSEITPRILGENLLITVFFKMKSSQSDTQAIINLDIGPGVGQPFTGFLKSNKSAGEVVPFKESFNVYAGSQVMTNKIKVKFQTEHNAQIFDTSVLVSIIGIKV